MKTKTYPQKTAQQVIASLPPACFTVTLHEGVETLVRIDVGTTGFSPCESPCNPQDAADYLNKTLNVTEKQVKAMVTGSQFGWHCPGADPNNPINL